MEMLLSSKSSPILSNGGTITTFPDLSLQISPPVAADEHKMTAGCRPLSSSSSGSDLSQENTPNNHHHYHKFIADQDDFVNQGAGVQFDQPQLTLGLEMGTLNHHHHHHHHPIHWDHHYHPPQIYTTHDFNKSSRIVNNSVRKSARAPRMRWTSTLHAHFIHAVQLLGGHERATPKSVQELMNVKDLTLAHVKSHLQMYRTVKSTDKGAAALADMQVINPRAPMSLFEIGENISPSSALQIFQRRSCTSSMETNDSSYTTKDNASMDCTPLLMNNTKMGFSKKMKKIESSGSRSSSDRLLDLEFKLGQPSRQVDRIF